MLVAYYSRGSKVGASVSLNEEKGEHGETGSREFPVREITCDRTPAGAQIIVIC